MCLLPSLKWSSTVSSLGIVQWNFTRRDHPGDPGRVFGSGPVIVSTRLHAISNVFMAKSGIFIGILQIVLFLFQCL